MAFEITEFATQLLNLVPEIDNELGLITRYQLIKQAVSEYSQDKPDVVSTDVSGDGGKYYALLSSLTSYDDGFSRIRSIEYPADDISDDDLPEYLEKIDWDEDFYADGIRYLFFPNHEPAATEEFRATYTALYSWSAATTTTSVSQSSHGFSLNDFVYQNSAGTWVSAGTGSTANLLATHQATTITDTDNFVATVLGVSIPESDFFAVCYKAACLACYAIAEYFARSSDSTITADSVNHTPRSSLFASRGSEFCAKYNALIGIKTDAQGNKMDDRTHADFVDLDTQPMFPSGRRYLFHDRRSR